MAVSARMFQDLKVRIENPVVLIRRFRRPPGPPAHLFSQLRMGSGFENGRFKRGEIIGGHDPADLFFFDHLGEFRMRFRDGDDRFTGGEHVIQPAGNRNPGHAFDEGYQRHVPGRQ